MRVKAILSLRCPRCLKGKVFEGLFRMHPTCPSCGLIYQREPGYFLGAMYFSYAMGIAAVTPACVALLMLDVSPGWIGLAALAQLLPISPLLLRYSRVLWLHLDQVFDPR